nr:endo-N-actetylneuraminidase [uncultured Mediterranean phage uvMED]
MALNINGTTGISGVDGSVSAPAVTGTDSNTGITFPSADTIKFSTGGVERMSITNSGVSGTGVGGAVKQVKKTVITALESISCDTSGTGSHDSSLAVTITPSSASNIIYVSAFAFGEGNTQDQSNFSTRLKKVVSGGSTSYYPAAVGNRNPIFSKAGTSNINATNTPDSFGIPNFPDTAGTTSAITYTLQFMYQGGVSSAGTYYLNRIVSDSNSTGYPNFVSWITAMEVEP